ncbi:alpha/beta hydrolase [Clostridium sp. CF012]|uniref:alpha/beta hydrolase n=1 Tax=Clostridium sp. CF012 TaxID=2843319 RepID=UPI001C0E7B8C|nr:alpha/beta hydrolase [Clostridium sp. CF012]MBU3146797.1 alpha/beta hydrolase [Clostridium sp. CF012]
MKKKKVIRMFLIVCLIIIIIGPFMFTGLIASKYGKLNIMTDIILTIGNLTKPGSLNVKSIPEIRDYLNKNEKKWNAKPIPFSNIKNMNIPSASNQVPVRIYTPSTGDKFPVIIYSHGGFWMAGNLDGRDNLCRKLSNNTNAIVVSVDYRLAPENPFPAGLNDVYSVLQWVSKNAESIHGNPIKICVAGDSAGGNLSAAVSQMARDKAGPHITCQVLIYPSTNISQLSTNSWTYFGINYTPTKEDSQKFLSLYTPKIQERKSPYASPILAKDFKKLPDALVITAEFDPLRDEGEDYARKLKVAGVQSVFTRYKGVIHGFITMDKVLKQADKATNEISIYLQKEFNKK